MYTLKYLAFGLLDEFRVLFSNPFEWAFFAFLFFVSFFSYQSKRILAWIVLLLAIAWAWFSRSLYQYLENIGTDSFFEAQDFNTIEAAEYLRLLFEYIAYHQDGVLEIESRLFLLLSFSLLLALLLRYVIERVKFLSSKKLIIISACCTTLFILAFLPIGKNLYPSWDAARERSNLTERLFDIGEGVFLPRLDVKARAINLITYIGESTSVLNMGVYGYSRDTTPQLSELVSVSDNVFRVDHVFSTHTHTTPSLLEALSVSDFHAERSKLPGSIFEQQRISIVEILKMAGIRTELFSNQGLSGSWNRAASVVFKGADRIEFSAKGLKFAGNFSGDFPRPFDHDFFGKHSGLNDESKKTKYSSVATFMHSYAGHWAYLKNIPVEFRNPIDNDYAKLSGKAIFGTTPADLKQLEGYDSAIRYVDFALSLRIREVLASDYPTVLIYFSDHGDSSFTGRGHDSSRFHFSMITVPMIIVVNEAARKEYPGLYKSLSDYVKSGRTKTLRDVPKLIANIFNITNIFNDERIFQFDETALPVLMRQLGNDITGVSLEFDQVSQEAYRSMGDARDDATRNFASARRFEEKNICYHRSNTVARAITGALSSGCIEFDVVVEGENIHVTHPPAKATGLGLVKLSQIVKGYKTAAWIDAKNINTVENCNRLHSSLKGIRDNFADVLVEFPSNSPFKNDVFNACIAKFPKIDVQTSYYLPTDKVILCAKAAGDVDKVVAACRELEAAAIMALASNVQGISFDYRGVGALKFIELSGDVKLHTWGINIEESLEDIERFQFLIPSNGDPNYW